MTDFTAEEDKAWDKKTITILKQSKVYSVENVWKLDHHYHKFAIISIEKNSVTLYATCRFMFVAEKIVCQVRKKFPETEGKRLYCVRTNYEIFPQQFETTLFKNKQTMDE